MKKENLFNSVSKFKVLKKEFGDLEDLVFKSGKNYYPPLIEYRLNIWKSKIDGISKWQKLCHHKSIKDLEVREISIRSQLINVKKIESEIKM